jgi:dTDP-4-amino-4,6-dideoxy-D-galactose acyltransferase
MTVTAGAGAGCRMLEWDSEFFGVRIARIEPSFVINAGPHAVETWCADNRIACAYLLADVGDQQTSDLAQTCGFRLVDVRVTLEADAPPSAAPDRGRRSVRVAGPDDVDSLKAIARESHRYTRFYSDGRFNRDRCDDLYEEWIVRSCGGWADRVLVVDDGGSCAGYLTCHVRNGAGQIGLFAVAAPRRGHGVGSALVAAARQWFAAEGADPVSVVTQARNDAALRLYQRAGMTVRSIQLWFHKWR